MSQQQYDTLSKVIVLGNSGVGKTSILLRLCQGTFTQNYISTIGMDFKVKILENSNGKKIKMQIWDTAGQERYRVLTQSFYKGASGIVLVYSVGDRASFTDIETWMKQIEDNTGGAIELMILGNKLDIEERTVSTQEGQEVSQKYRAKFYEVSAKQSVNINEAFASLALNLKPKSSQRPPASTPSLVLTNGSESTESEQKQKKRRRYCC